MDRSVLVAADTPAAPSNEATSTHYLWNEGRVVGYSAYEIYVRQQLLENPNEPVATEREWLAASLASGAAMLVKLTSDDGTTAGSYKIVNIQLPENTQLCAANTIVASLFYGSGNTAEYEKFATSVASYGDLLSREWLLDEADEVFIDSIGNRNNCQPGWNDTTNKVWLERVRSYLHVVDGIVTQTGYWSNTESGTIDFKPKLNHESDNDANPRPTLSFRVNGEITTDIWILLTGFTMRNIASGETKYETSSLSTPHPHNGDFLGPEVFPWANKIIFSAPSHALSMPIIKTKVGSATETTSLNDTPVIDMKHCDPSTYYGSNHKGSRVEAEITDLMLIQDGVAMLVTHQRDTRFAPALYGAVHDSYKVASGGQSVQLSPLDTVAPRTIKLFHGVDSTTNEDDLAKALEETIPYNFALIRYGDDYVLRQMKWDGDSATILPVADANVQKVDNKYYTEIDIGSKSTIKAISLTNLNGEDLPLTGSSGTDEADTITWKMLLEALGLNHSIDVLGAGLRSFKETLNDIFDGDGIKDTTTQYVVRVKKVSNNYEIYFEPITIPSTVEFSVSKKPYVLSATAKDAKGNAKTYTTISLQDNNENELDLAGSDGEVEYGDSGLSWAALLNALGTNQKIHTTHKALRSLQGAMSTAPKNATYLITKIDDDTFKLDTPTEVDIPKFPKYVLERVRMDPVIPVDNYHGAFVKDLVLDVFGYVSETDPTDSTESKSFNTFTTLTHTKGTRYYEYTKYGLVQQFSVNPDDYDKWCNICDALYAARKLQWDDERGDKSAAKVIFTTGGRPIYNSYDSDSPKERKLICAPDKSISVVAYIQPIYRATAEGAEDAKYVKYRSTQDTGIPIGHPTVHDVARTNEYQPIVNKNNPVRGLLIWADVHETMGWRSSPSSGSYVGSLVGDLEDQQWTPSFWQFDPQE